MILSICQLANQINQCIYITHLSTPPPPQKTKNLECKTIRREVGWRAQILIWVWNILSRPTLPPVSLKSCINSDIFKVHIFWKFVHHIFLHYWCVFRNLSIKQKLIEKVHICLENSECMYVCSMMNILLFYFYRKTNNRNHFTKTLRFIMNESYSNVVEQKLWRNIIFWCLFFWLKFFPAEEFNFFCENEFLILNQAFISKLKSRMG